MPKSLAYIVSQFPSFSETFIQREVHQLMQDTQEVTVFSLKTPADIGSEINVKETDIDENCRYNGFFSYSILKSNLLGIVRYRLSIVITFFYILWQLRQTPMEALKTVAVFPKSIHYTITIHNSDIEHIHAHWANVPTSVAYIITLLLDDVSYSFTGHAWDIHSNDTNSQFLKTKIDNARFIVTCTEYNRRYLNRINDSSTPIYLNYHGLLPEQYSNSRDKDEKTYFVAGGRLVEKKGFINLVEALGEIKKQRGHEIPTIIFGDGPQRDDLESLKREYDLDKLKLVGQIDHEQVREYLEKAQAFVAPSVVPDDGDIDGIPNVILEAFATSTPAIGSDLSGIPEVVLENETGWLVKPDSIDDLVSACLNAWEMPERCDQFGRNGRSLVEQQFDIEKNIDEYIGILENELSEK